MYGTSMSYHFDLAVVNGVAPVISLFQNQLNGSVG